MISFNKIWQILLLFIVIIAHQYSLFCEEKLVVASFNPILTDFAKNIGGESIELIEVMKPGENPHKFKPAPEDLKNTARAKILLFMGKGLEIYLPKTRDLFHKDQVVLEVGKWIPSLTISKSNDLFVCCPTHNQGGLDPHWWQSIKNAIKAIRIIYKAFKEHDPKNEKNYYNNYLSYKKELDELYKWAKREISKIPRKDRNLTTSHAAFGYFCKEFGFRAVPVQGLSKEQNPNPDYLKEVIQIIKKENIKAAFPEQLANPKILDILVNDTGIVLGKKLIPGSPETYIGMMKNNVQSIVDALGNPNEG